MTFTPLNYGDTAVPIVTPTAEQKNNLLPCGPFDLGLLNGLLKDLADRIDLIDAADNATTGGSYNSATNILTLTMLDGPSVDIDMTPVLSDFLAAISLSGYVPTTRTVTTALPMTGGGALSSNLALGIDIPQLVAALEPSFTNPSELSAAIAAALAGLVTRGSNASGFWARMPGNVLHQWGTAAGSGVEGAGSIAFPVAFADTNYGITMTAIISSAGDFDNHIQELSGTRTTNGLNIYFQDASSGGSSAIAGVSWMAIGTYA